MLTVHSAGSNLEIPPTPDTIVRGCLRRSDPENVRIIYLFLCERILWLLCGQCRWGPAGDVGSPGTGVTYGCELPGNKTWVLWKNSLLSCLSSLSPNFLNSLFPNLAFHHYQLRSSRCVPLHLLPLSSESILSQPCPLQPVRF